MTDRMLGEDPLPSSELERDREQSGQTTVTPSDAEGHTLPASEAHLAAGEEGDEEPVPAPSAMLPPD